MLEMLNVAESVHFSWASLLFFSSRPVVDLTVSMTFNPVVLPMVFTGKMDVELCFEVDSFKPGNGWRGMLLL